MSWRSRPTNGRASQSGTEHRRGRPRRRTIGGKIIRTISASGSPTAAATARGAASLRLAPLPAASRVCALLWRRGFRQGLRRLHVDWVCLRGVVALTCDRLEALVVMSMG